MKKKKTKIKIEELDPGMINNMIDPVIRDALIELLIRKKIITKKELQKEIQGICKEMNKDMNKFMKENPTLIDELHEHIASKQSEKKEASYIG